MRWSNEEKFIRIGSKRKSACQPGGKEGPNMEQERIVLSHVTTPRGELQLQKRAGKSQPVYEIIFNGVFLIASYNRLSEMKLATLALEPLASHVQGLKVLIGGLGIGYTLRAALDWPSVQAVDVVEIETHIIKWAKGFFWPTERPCLRRFPGTAHTNGCGRIRC